MKYPCAKILLKFSLLMLLALSLNPYMTSAAEKEGCKNKCILKSQIDDQDCAIEKTPLYRCENFEQFEEEDKRLNREYRKLAAKLADKEKTYLIQPQRKWIKWRNEQCETEDMEANCTYGICAGVEHDNCILNLTKRRADELSRFNADITKAKMSRFEFSKQPSDIY